MKSTATLLVFCLSSLALAQGKPKPSSSAPTPKTVSELWPESRGKALVDPGPPKMDESDSDQTLTCDDDSRCNWGGRGGNICTPNKVCLCDASKGLARCGKKNSAIQDCSNLLTGLNCGVCGHECPKGQLCNDGKCARVQCAKGETFCGARCSNLRNSNFDCGACFHECRNGLSCVKGHCAL